MKMNLPNRLTVLRLILVPIFVAVMMASDALWAEITGLALFCVAAYTDRLDGKLARKRGLVTDFGKFLDPLADKFMVIGAMLVILYKSMLRAEPSNLFCNVFFWGLLIVFFRELAVTSMRLVVSGSSGIVIAANMLGKIKTVSQILCVIVCIVEPIVYGHGSAQALSMVRHNTPLSSLPHFRIQESSSSNSDVISGKSFCTAASWNVIRP